MFYACVLRKRFRISTAFWYQFITAQDAFFAGRNPEAGGPNRIHEDRPHGDEQPARETEDGGLLQQHQRPQHRAESDGETRMSPVQTARRTVTSGWQ